MTEAIASHTDPAGTNTGDTYQLLLHNVSPGVLSSYSQLTGQPNANYGSNQDVVLNFTPAQLEALQQTADDEISAATHEPGYDHPMSPEQVQRYFQQNPYGTLPGMGGAGIPLSTLAEAKNPAQILQAIQNAGDGDPSATLYKLFYTIATSPKHSPTRRNSASPRPRVCGKSS